MTKPAAFVLQLTGLIMALVGAGTAVDGSAVTGGFFGILGVGLFLWGGYGVRKRIKDRG